ncbi:ABC transporter G family member 23-like [Folsomia candida]|uniref:ABC transporter G family member 23 n=1 Tax=Folsomia candida TaxID=158441 RepID=A0A226DKF0_FOLCA|nr:ABC transporter G family member 23-like [Folsomia candida]XP_035713676.1 ABC transporter G family member 23-like [Folsomia candida]XP_035713677.1 ABC transporter G family member 23-like [Folsomia candida]XP_035713678.1 ABC transporter G family member 23-like [Folsomia candida]XP_035713679.1 ABC transporter G family member 23-like [Folsomia candida]XP_035713680.1 ABC transporter G family member 23-like [Folsomia candida]XP_035713681.1 ABC transporter G family member 23-like [Folsomia candid
MALTVRNIVKRYESCGELVLNNLNLNVAVGEIYGLLGASGCGKTTLLSCIVGLREVDAGEIIVFGKLKKKQGSLANLCGWMPQEIALLGILTIREVFEYFGSIYAMKPTHVQERIEFLSSFLNLPSINSGVRNLSGGQMRRVSLAVAMIHDPPVLILDEPTVGLDPLLRQKIWEYLTQISRQHAKTIIISTHYIEETSRCDKLGLMRRGKLLVEDIPQNILSQCNSTSLEEACSKLCHMDECALNATKWEEFRSSRTFQHATLRNNDSIPPLEVKIDNYRAILGVIVKTWHRRRRDFRFLFAQVIIPIILIVSFETIVGPTPKGTRIGLISNGNGNTSTALCTVNTSLSNNCLENTGICDFLKLFDDNEFDWVATDSHEDAMRNVQLGNTLGFLEFSHNFADHMRLRILHRIFSDNETILGSNISVKMDASNSIRTTQIYEMLIQKYYEFIENAVVACDIDKSRVRLPLKFGAIYGRIDSEFISFIEPGVMIIFIFILQALTHSRTHASGVLWTLDRSEGLEDRDYAAGVTLMHKIVGNAFTNSIQGLMQIGIFLSLFCGVYGMEISGSMATVILFAYVSSMSGTAYGWMIATYWDGIIETIMIIKCSAIIQSFSSGMAWPTETIPWTYRQLCNYLLPTTFQVDAFRSICLKGWSVTHPNVVRGFITAMCWIVLSIIICFRADRRKHK